MRILVADDEPAILKLLTRQLERAGFEVASAKDGREAWEAFCAAPFPVVLTDLNMPNVDGFELVRRIRNSREGSTTQIIVCSASGDDQQTLDLLDGSVFECLVKPEGVRRIPEVAWRAANAWEKLVSAKDETPPHNGTGSSRGLHDTLWEERQFMAVSEHMREVVALALRFHEAPEIPVLIQGDTGTGKEAVARLVHQGMRPDNTPFVDVNCAAISPSLLESELFGYAPGAFTGANHGGQVGKFEMADGGTIFLDELGEMPLGFQSKLLRVLEDKAIRRVGGDRENPDQRADHLRNQPRY